MSRLIACADQELVNTSTYARLGQPTGATGLRGSIGCAGKRVNMDHIWIAYADSADGTINFTNGEAANRRFVGVSTCNESAAPSADPHDYHWMTRGCLS